MILDNAVSTATSLLVALVHHNPIYIASHLLRFTGHLNSRLDVATHFIQQAQHPLLAVDFLPPGWLQSLLHQITNLNQRKWLLSINFLTFRSLPN
jgi:hypothetical protein